MLLLLPINVVGLKSPENDMSQIGQDNYYPALDINYPDCRSNHSELNHEADFGDQKIIWRSLC
jgi:hypothetical protein